MISGSGNAAARRWDKPGLQVFRKAAVFKAWSAWRDRRRAIRWAQIIICPQLPLGAHGLEAKVLRAVVACSVGGGELIEGGQGLGAVDHRRATAHLDRHGNGLHDLLAARAFLQGRAGVIGDATLALDRHRDRVEQQLTVRCGTRACAEAKAGWRSKRPRRSSDPYSTAPPRASAFGSSRETHRS